MFKRLLASLIVLTGLALGQVSGTPDINGKYDKRKSVGQPKERTGEYSDDEMENTFRGESSSRNADGMDGMKKPDCVLGTPCAPIVRETQQAPPHSHQ